MYHWRSAFLIGGIFVIVGILYGVLQGRGEWLDHAGATMLIVLGGAMAFAFGILLHGTKDL